MIRRLLALALCLLPATAAGAATPPLVLVLVATIALPDTLHDSLCHLDGIALLDLPNRIKDF